ncbi:MAG: glycogen synthase GlgA [Deltaproteobacteria bacterium]|nr:glycogen synthase GlgA [Deltaproteobacteria bacterium]
MRVLMVTPEVTPFAQTGGLGEVLSALPVELASLGVEIDVLMPKYRGINTENFDINKLDITLEVTLNAKNITAGIWQFVGKNGTRYLFLECDDYYDREYLYGTPEGDYEDNAERFVFLTRAALELALYQGKPYDVFHSHDWQAALTAVYIRTLYAGESLFRDSSTVMTIHNLGYQGIFWHLDMPLVGVGWEFFTPKHMEFHGKLNFLKSGTVFADEVSTVSPGYRSEILTPEFGFGLEGILQEKGDHLTGILNGVDYSIWNPQTDPYVASTYSPENIQGKPICKAELQELANLPLDPGPPLIAMVSRLSSQKGVDIFAEAFDAFMRNDVQVVVLGTGEARYQAIFTELAEKYPNRVGAFLRYDYGLAHKIFAGADILLVPSRYEPCGLNQLYALKYGAVPVVTATGGLTDTVDECDVDADVGTGFKFFPPNPLELEKAVSKAIRIYKDRPDAWKRLMKRGMNKDFSWNRSAREYLLLYERAIADRHAYFESIEKA